MAEIMSYSAARTRVWNEEMRRDPTIFWLKRSGPNKARVEEFGWGREKYTTSGIAETQICGAGLGAAIAGLRPIVDVGYGDFYMDAWGQLVLQAAKQRFKMAYTVDIPVVFCITYGGILQPTIHHSGQYHNWLANSPGLIVTVPTTPRDAMGLWRTALRDTKDPVCMCRDRSVGGVEGPVPDALSFQIPFGKGDVKREGSDVTIAAIGHYVHRALEVAEVLANEGIDVEVWDPRCLLPFDREGLVKSVRKTGAMVTIDSSPKTFGSCGEFMATVAEAITPVPPMARCASKDVPVGASTPLREWQYPNNEGIASAVRDVLKRKG